MNIDIKIDIDEEICIDDGYRHRGYRDRNRLLDRYR